MFGSMQNPSSAYAKIGVETGVTAANPHKLILMLFDGALMSLGTATRAMQQGQIAEKGQAISKAIDIIVNGLKLSLSSNDSSGLSEKLAALYDYMADRLLSANLKNDKKIIEEVSGLLRELRGAWEEIARDPAVVSDSRRAA
ncbi:MAG: flagellar export chaperone FliS [Rhodocyclaceae bacterium]